MNSYKEKIGYRIRRERLVRNITIEELAEMLNLSTAFIGLIERGYRGCKIDNLVKIADMFGLTVNDLVYDKEDDLQIREPKYSSTVIDKQNAVATFAKNLNEKELDIIINTIKGLNDLSRFYTKPHDIVSESEIEETEALNER
ncbi:MAG: helix-turn-helix transcriptional regulator [Defluviitaleaceae bacterium]|nr:helix-turn-helix transcriptional regulator [Defluviitaleaceae bacterium]